MKLLRFFFRYSPQTMVRAALTAMLAGVCNAGLIAVVNAVLSGTLKATTGVIVGFIALGVVRLMAHFFAQITLTRFAQLSTANLRHELVEKILGVPLRQLEEIGSARLMVTLTEDVLSVTEAMRIIPSFVVNFAVLLGGAAYLGWLSLQMLMLVTGLIVLGALGYRVLVRSGFTMLKSAREAEDRLFGHFRALIEGIKELKLHRHRRHEFLHTGVKATTNEYRQHNVAAETRFALAQNWSQFLFFSLIACVLFLMPKLDGVNAHAMTAYVVVTLYLMGPLSAIMFVFPVFGRAQIALQKIEKIGLKLTERSSDLNLPVPNCPPMGMNRLELIDISHAYRRENEDDTFTLGPINLTFTPGEIVFLVGGNGSGKSTLAKIITGLYPPAKGEIRFNGKLIDEHNRDHYRQLFSAVFADFYLFDTFVGLEKNHIEERATAYLSELQLEHKVKVVNGALSTTELSQGQRKRLALLTAYLEDRPFYLFDEWASDQDPLFKTVFYTKLLPELRARNKSILVISHDDRYFHLADRLVKLDSGQLVSIATEQAVVKPRVTFDSGGADVCVSAASAA
jgi:putative pyoverdin transport system ATP-binding/permease protein